MICSETEILRALERGTCPPMILVGGDNEYLSDRAFSSIRRALLERDAGRAVESFSEGADLGVVLDSYRTHSLFGGARVLVVPEVNAFVSRKELASLLDKALADWSGAKTDRKRASSLAKLLHVLGLVGLDLEQSDGAIASALGAEARERVLVEMLGAARASGKKATRGEDDAALLAEAATHGGAPGAVLLMRTGEIPSDSATVAAIARAGAVVVCNLTRGEYAAALDEAIGQIAGESRVRFETAAVRELKARMGIERILSDKFSKDVPDLRSVIAEADRLATFVGNDGRVTVEIVRQQVAELGGGMRWELGSLFAEGKPLEAVSKLRELVAEAMREEGRSSEEIHYGRFLFAFADEIRQLLAIHSWARTKGFDLRRGIPYMRFKDTIAEPLSEYLKANELVRQKPHPFPLHKRWEGARLHREQDLLTALDQIAELEFLRKSGGVPIDVALETIVMGSGSRQ